MSAQKTPRRGVLGGILGIAGFSALAGLLVTVMVAPAVALTGAAATSTIGVFDSLPEYIELGDLPERNEIYVNSGEGPRKIATLFSQNREEVSYDQISRYALDAAVYGEDRRFFEHGGVDVPGVVRAAVANFTGGGIESGASTLTMQVVKNIYVLQAMEKPTQEEIDAAYAAATAEDFGRKLKEMKLAIGLEKRYTKKEILTSYLNMSNFGDATYGIQAAAQRYFGVNAADLNPAQAASLVAIVQYPNSRNLGDPENFGENEIRRDYILGTMLAAGSITQEEYDIAYNTPVDENFVNLQPASNGCIAADQYAKWFCDYVERSVPDFEFLGATEQERRDNWKKGGYKLYTTLDYDAQFAAQQALWAYAPNTETAFSLGGAVSSVEPGTGRVLVMAQNMVFNDSATPEFGTSAVNYNTSIGYGSSTGFQPGSTYKIFTLLEWLKQGKGVNERINGGPIRNEPGSNWTDRCGGTGGTVNAKNNAGESGSYTIRDGTVNSVNGVFYRMAKELDLCNINELAAEMGVERADGEPLNTFVSSIIGTNEVTPLSMANSYATLSALGKHCQPIIVDTFTNRAGENLPAQPQKCNQTSITPEVAATAIDVLKGVMVTGNQLYSNPEDGIPIFGKTGTTDSGWHTWMAAATSKAATVVWVGNSIGEYPILETEYNGVAGIRLRHYIMNATQTVLNIKMGGEDWPGPDESLLKGAGQEVPNVAGQSDASAARQLEGLGFTIAWGGEVDSDLPQGTVVRTEPAAGSNVAKGSEVYYYTSRANMTVLPDAVANGETYNFADAKALLAGSGFTKVSEGCVVVPEGDDREGKVTASDPAAGTLVVSTSPVKLVVGKTSC